MARLSWAILFGLAGLFLGSAALATEEPAFKILMAEGDFAIRDYPAVTVAEERVDGDQGSAGNRGFRLLAGYIFGGNQAGRSISMTAPVAMEPGEEHWKVRFFMPEGMTSATLPAPNDPAVTLHDLAPSRMAVLQFSGWADGRDLEEKGAILLNWVTVHGLSALGRPILAQYNPPWTLWFMRRNEVMVAIEGELPP
jgi:hypothetical protein